MLGAETSSEMSTGTCADGAGLNPKRDLEPGPGQRPEAKAYGNLTRTLTGAASLWADFAELCDLISAVRSAVRREFCAGEVVAADEEFRRSLPILAPRGGVLLSNRRANAH